MPIVKIISDLIEKQLSNRYSMYIKVNKHESQ